MASSVPAPNEDVPVDEPLDEESAEPILSRLDAIEAKLGGTTVPVRVVDAGDGVTPLRLLGEVDLEHSQTVEVSVPFLGHISDYFVGVSKLPAHSILHLRAITDRIQLALPW